MFHLVKAPVGSPPGELRVSKRAAACAQTPIGAAVLVLVAAALAVKIAGPVVAAAGELLRVA